MRNRTRARQGSGEKEAMGEKEVGGEMKAGKQSLGKNGDETEAKERERQR